MAGDSTQLTEAVARNYFKLLAIKDEYEVARLYTDGEFERQVAAAFEGDYKLRYHFAPPLWVKPDKVTGAPVKRTVRRVDAPGAGGAREIQGHCAARGSIRSATRRSAGWNGSSSPTTSARWRSSNAACAPTTSRSRWKWRRCPATIRGYGHVKRRNIDAAKAREAALLGAVPQSSRAADASRGLILLHSFSHR